MISNGQTEKHVKFTLGNYAQPEYAILQAPEMFIPGISVAIFATCTCSVTRKMVSKKTVKIVGVVILSSSPVVQSSSPVL